MSWWGIGFMAGSAILNVAGQNKAKKAGQADAEFEAGQLERKAIATRATGQRDAAEQRRQARLLESALQARAGGGGLDPGVVKLQTDIAGEGEYRALSALYESNEAASGMEEAAAASRRTGRARSSAANYQMAGTVLSSANSMYGRYKAA